MNSDTQEKAQAEGEQSPRTYQLLVHKANIPLAKGESISQFTSRLSEAGRKMLNLKLNLTSFANSTNKNAYTSVYMIEAFAKSAIFDVYSYKGDGQSSAVKYYAVKYDRNANGDFSFSDLTEVERHTSFVPKAALEVTKNKESSPPVSGDPGVSEQEVWKNSGWRQLFNGVL